jgi:cell wall-associated NlpC family hydrolase
MTTARTTRTARSARSARSTRTARGAVVAVLAGAGMLLSPLPSAVAEEPAPAAATAAPSSAARTAVDTALAQVGKPYQYGGAGPDSFDCSGLTQFAYRAAGIELPHSSRSQATMGVPIDNIWDLQPGDLLFFYSPVSHVGIYIGDGQMVHASTEGQPVSVVDARDVPDYAGARRIA